MNTIEALAKSIHHSAKQTIKANRDLVRDLEWYKKKFGWRWNQQHPIENKTSGGDKPIFPL